MSMKMLCSFRTYRLYYGIPLIMSIKDGLPLWQPVRDTRDIYLIFAVFGTPFFGRNFS